MAEDDAEMVDTAGPSDANDTDQGQKGKVSTPNLAEVLWSNLGLINKAVDTRDAKLLIGRVLRLTSTVRSQLGHDALRDFIMEAMPESVARVFILGILSGESMEADTAPGELAPSEPLKSKAQPEVEMYCFFLVCQRLVDQKDFEKLLIVGEAGVAYAAAFNRRTLDVLAARVTFYQALAYERAGRLREIRPALLAAHCRAVLHHNTFGQEVLLNLLLRSYLEDSLYDQAEKLRAQAARPEGARSNQQYSRYLFYLGRIRAAQLEYSEAKECLSQAARKAPMVAVGFSITVSKWLLVVRLLLGEEPERADFEPRSVRGGDVAEFGRVEEAHHRTFEEDRIANLVGRLRYNVLRSGLRRISLAYSRISLQDIARKLGLERSKDVETIVAKTIRDGSISAMLDHEQQVLMSKEIADVYITTEPQQAFHVRTAFCMDVHNEAVRAMRYDLAAEKEDGDATPQNQADLEEKIAAALAEGEDDF